MANNAITNIAAAHSHNACISLQDSIAYMIPDPSAHALNISSEFESCYQPIRNNYEQIYGINSPDDTLQDQIEGDSREVPSERQRNSIERQRQVRNESHSRDVLSVVFEEHPDHTFQHQQRNRTFSPLSNPNYFMADTFCLPAGCRIRSPKYTLFQNRLRTFANWPRHLSQTPKQLAEAGFYSLETEDVVRCFACDGGLKNWEPEDDPWIEHARWFSSCDYLLHVKGEEFVQLVGLMYEESDDEDKDDQLMYGKGELVKDMQELDLDVNKGDTEPSVLDADCVQSVIQTGFSEISVIRAINDLLKEGRKDYVAQDIVSVILDREEQVEPKMAQTSSSVDTGQGYRSLEDGCMAHMQEHENLKLRIMCTECKEYVRNVLFLPCQHHTVCEKCSSQIYVCFTCFRIVREKVKTYM